jgi:DUF1365 family protein
MSADALRSGIYHGTVFHRRLRPKRHELRYAVFSLLLDLDELPELDAKLRGFGHNRWQICSFLDRDHGDGRVGGLRHWVEQRLREAGIAESGLRIAVLCYPRILGYVFNPLSVYFCRRADGTLVAMLYEVNNTFGDRHTYVLPVAPETAEASLIRQDAEKRMHVSPFNRVVGRYDFSIRPPAADVSVGIVYRDDEGPLLVATFAGDRTPLDSRHLAAALLRHPLMTLKVVAGIHWEALRLLLKGVRFQRHPRRQPARLADLEQPKTTAGSHVA